MMETIREYVADKVEFEKQKYLHANPDLDKIVMAADTIIDSFDSLFCVSVRGALGSFIPLLAPSFLPLTLVYNVKYVLKNGFSSLSNLPFTPLFLPLLWG